MLLTRYFLSMWYLGPNCNEYLNTLQHWPQTVSSIVRKPFIEISLCDSVSKSSYAQQQFTFATFLRSITIDGSRNCSNSGSRLSWLESAVAAVAYGGRLRSTGCMNLTKYRVNNILKLIALFTLLKKSMTKAGGAAGDRFFLANVNSRSRSLYVVVRPSVVCRLSVTFVHPTQAIEIFGNISTPFGTMAIC